MVAATKLFGLRGVLPSRSEPPVWGHQKGVTPICSNLFRFPRFLPICSDLRSLFSGIPRFLPICSDFFRFVFKTNQNKSGKPPSADLFCNSPTRTSTRLPASRRFLRDCPYAWIPQPMLGMAFVQGLASKQWRQWNRVSFQRVFPCCAYNEAMVSMT